jgi:glucose/arabinose dehydrogenase
MGRATLIALVAVALVTAGCGEAGVTPTTAGDGAGPTVAPTTSVATTTTAPATTTTTDAAATTTTTTTVDIADVRLALQPVASVFEQPAFLTAPPGDPRLFIVDQPGRIWVISDGDPEVFLDIRDEVGFGGERGLLGLAFHPDYAANGRFFVDYTDVDGDTRVMEYTVAADDPDRADPASGRILLAVGQPAGNHNGGMIAFGPDGYLWIGMGDGGGGGDTYGNGQRADTVLGAMLRIDVDGGDPYVIPADNPYADGAAGAPEVWATGLRNPWRFAFDEGLVYIADVGQNEWEEIDAAPVDAAGLNYGWPITEGTHCFSPSSGCDTDGLTLPVFEYSHDEGCSVTGGYVYRGTAIPGLAGHYLFSDYCAGVVRSFRLDGGAPTDVRSWEDDLGRIASVTSFGLDAAGEIYVVSGDGEVFRIVPAA